MKLSKFSFIALVVAISVLIQGAPPMEPSARAAEPDKKESATKKKAEPKGGPLTVPELAPIQPEDIPAGELIQPKELSKPPAEPLPMPLAIPQVDKSNPESVALAEAHKSGKRVEIVSARTEETTPGPTRKAPSPPS